MFCSADYRRTLGVVYDFGSPLLRRRLCPRSTTWGCARRDGDISAYIYLDSHAHYVQCTHIYLPLHMCMTHPPHFGGRALLTFYVHLFYIYRCTFIYFYIFICIFYLFISTRTFSVHRCLGERRFVLFLLPLRVRLLY